ncbi:hypothetical protein BDV96DRAFT_575294 [Lophiotrema nucula]|uniref:Uncharacterized protein n=1 Tax=Lophiotrema nucula TaxID=690887 RepID=A0A6A5Z8C8_9PLEO|nr:hypothetical protein BDV96DRAFT_575294 [Lophiotrema nucula]
MEQYDSRSRRIKRERSPSPLSDRDAFIKRENDTPDFSRSRHQSAFKPSRKFRRLDEDNRVPMQDDRFQPPQRHTRLTPQERDRLRAQGGCFYCRKITNPRHGASQCPKKIAVHGPSPSVAANAPPSRNNFTSYVPQPVLKKEDTPSELYSGGADNGVEHSGIESGLSDDGSEDLPEDDSLDVSRNEVEPFNNISSHEPGSRYRFNFGKHKGQSLFSLPKSNQNDRFGGIEDYIRWMKAEHMPLQYGREDLANGLEYYHRTKLEKFEAKHPYASEYVFEKGQFKGTSISEVPDWYVYDLEEKARMSYASESGSDDDKEDVPKAKLRRRSQADAIEWRKKLQDTNRWMWHVEKDWHEKKRKGVHRTKFSWKPKLLGPFAYPTTLAIKNIETTKPYPCKCPTCAFAPEGGKVVVKERPSEKRKREREDEESFMYDFPFW